MPFGLSNAPATFQSYISRALDGLIDVFVIVYLDDILIYSKNETDHIHHVRAVLDRLRTYGLYVKLSKCAFHVDTVHFLGYIITPQGLKMDPGRIQMVVDWPLPTCVRDVLSFNDFANFYRRFIKDYSKIIAPLTDLTRGGTPQKKRFQLPKEAVEAFEKLKEAFTQAPILRHFDWDLPIRVETDASMVAIAGVISQLHGDRWYPIAYSIGQENSKALRLGMRFTTENY